MKVNEFLAGCVLALAWAGIGHASPPQSAPIPPTKEIEILDPNVDPTGYPAVLRAMGMDGVERIAIPPSILVHRYYYTGERSFQGPLLTGGPCIVVASHPRTAERLYMDVTLPPGAPRVIYRKNSIEYSYPGQSVTIEFSWLFAHKPKVVYRDGKTVVERVCAGYTAVRDTTKMLVERTGLTEGVATVRTGAKDLVIDTADRIRDVGTLVVTPVKQVVRILPGVSLLTRTPEERAERTQELEIRRAALEAEKERLLYLPTNR